VRGVCGGFRLFGGPGLLLRKSARNAGGAAVEFAITAPVLVVLAIGGADYSIMAHKQDALEAATRAGAEYARANYFTDPNWAANTNNYVTEYMAFSPEVTVSPSTVCTCADGTSPAPNSCAGACSVGNPPDTRVLKFVSITATQDFSPLLAWRAFGFPATLSAMTMARVQ
jgi:Flp pilus assembly protein TadG